MSNQYEEREKRARQAMAEHGPVITGASLPEIYRIIFGKDHPFLGENVDLPIARMLSIHNIFYRVVDTDDKSNI